MTEPKWSQTLHNIIFDLLEKSVSADSYSDTDTLSIK
jgi:hypothetical protein